MFKLNLVKLLKYRKYREYRSKLSDIMRKQTYLERGILYSSAGQVSLTSECHLKIRKTEGKKEGREGGKRKRRKERE